jgi:hypothetical protein
MVEYVLSNDKQGNEEIEGEIKFSLHYHPIVDVPYLDVKRKNVWIDLAVGSQHPTTIQTR